MTSPKYSLKLIVRTASLAWSTAICLKLATSSEALSKVTRQ